MIIGTAGHIDHGKTALIMALTGTDTDRLAEEKRRGLTIDLGYAYHDLPDGNVMGFVDVPGHERFVHNMLSGALGIDYVLFVIAADDGPMPQTREHLAIVDLLELTEGVVALSKVDLVTRERLQQVEQSIRTLLEGTSLERADVVRVSARNGTGIDELYRRLAQVAKRQSFRASGGHFRLAVDRSFSLTGAGTVVTGTVHSGEVRLDDHVVVSPRELPARVRDIHCQNKKAERGRAGDRCALNLAGSRISKKTIRRGDWIVAPAVHRPSARLDCRLKVLSSESRPLRHWTPVHVHIGAADVGGRVAVLEKATIAPGGSGLVQIVLERPVPALRKDRFVVRDQSAVRTVAGGSVLDPAPRARGRRKPQRLAVLSALALPTATASFKRLLEIRAGQGLNLDWFALTFNLRPDALEVLQKSTDIHVFQIAAQSLGMMLATWLALKDKVIEALTEHHRRLPNETGMTQASLQHKLRDITPAPMIKLAIDSLVTEKRMLRHGALFHLPGHVDRLSPLEENLWRRMYRKIEAGGLRPPRPRELAETLREDRGRIKAVLRRQARSGKICEVSEELFVPLHTIGELAAKVETLCNNQDGSPMTMRTFREATGTHRSVTIEVLEYFDRVGLTLRVHDGRRLRGSPRAMFIASEGP